MCQDRWEPSQALGYHGGASYHIRIPDGIGSCSATSSPLYPPHYDLVAIQTAAGTVPWGMSARWNKGKDPHRELPQFSLKFGKASPIRGPWVWR